MNGCDPAYLFIYYRSNNTEKTCLALRGQIYFDALQNYPIHCRCISGMEYYLWKRDLKGCIGLSSYDNVQTPF